MNSSIYCLAYQLVPTHYVPYHKDFRASWLGQLDQPEKLESLYSTNYVVKQVKIYEQFWKIKLYPY